MTSEQTIIEQFKANLISQLKEETEQEIKTRVNEFENHLREMASAKIVSFVDKLKIIVKQETNTYEPKMIIEVHL